MRLYLRDKYLNIMRKFCLNIDIVGNCEGMNVSSISDKLHALKINLAW